MAGLAERTLIIPLRSFFALPGVAMFGSAKRPKGSDERLLVGGW